MYEEILDIAEDLFMRQGYNDTSTRQIAKILNITQPNIYYHFKNKEEIYFQVMKRLSTEVGKNLSDLSKKAGSFEARVTHGNGLLLAGATPVQLIHDDA